MIFINSYVQPYGGDLPLDYLTWLDASDSYVPTMEGLQLFSDGRGFYAAEMLPQWSYVTATIHVTDSALASPFEPSSAALEAPPSTPLFMQPSDPPSALSDDEVRSLIEQYIQAAPWFREHAHEPLVGEGVPTCALQLAPEGGSVYQCFVVQGNPKKNKPVFKCATCKYTSDRLHRVVGHQRIKRKHKPFACGGACGNVGCEFRGPTKESLGDHQSRRNNATWCPECREPIIIKNLNRHVQEIHGF